MISRGASVAGWSAPLVWARDVTGRWHISTESGGAASRMACTRALELADMFVTGTPVDIARHSGEPRPVVCGRCLGIRDAKEAT